MCSEHHPSHHSVVRVAPRQPTPEGEGGQRIPLAPVDSISITTLCDNVTDMLLVDQGPAKRAPLGGPKAPRVAVQTLEAGFGVDALHAEHGFSALVTVRSGEHVHRFLFDTGVTPDGMIENMRRLDLSPKDVEVIVLSHGHFDHTAGLDGFIRSVGRPNLPVLIHPEFWTRRRLNIPGRTPIVLPSTSRGALEGAGFEIIEERRPSFLFEGMVLITGEVDRTTPFERGFPVHEAERDGSWVADPLILDDQAMIVDVRGKGLVVLTGCGHAGVVNILHYARRLTGTDRIHAVIGGFHLSGPIFEPIIGPTCDGLAALAPDVLVPAHCTGWKAVHALASRFPSAFIQNSVGTRFEL
jgi:7,8-dihydropterin-6-yl-methyl-4-(beta-D-ribofuranosyl)aminobenzene 5'-phosphate synthase